MERASRFTEGQIVMRLKEQKAGAVTADVCRRHDIGSMPTGASRSCRMPSRTDGGSGSWPRSTRQRLAQPLRPRLPGAGRVSINTL